MREVVLIFCDASKHVYFRSICPVFVLCANPLKEVVDVFTIRAIKQMSSFNLFIFSFFSLKLKSII